MVMITVKYNLMKKLKLLCWSNWSLNDNSVLSEAIIIFFSYFPLHFLINITKQFEIHEMPQIDPNHFLNVLCFVSFLLLHLIYVWFNAYVNFHPKLCFSSNALKIDVEYMNYSLYHNSILWIIHSGF